MDELMWRSRIKKHLLSLQAVQGVHSTLSIYSAYLLKNQSENKKLSRNV